MRVLLFANTDWYLYNFRRSLALAIEAAGHEVLLVSPAGPYGRKLIDLGLRWVPAPMRRLSLNPFRELALLVWLWRLMRAEKIDLAHSFTIKCAVYGGLSARFAGAARINAIAGMGYVFTSDSRLARTLRPVVRALMRVALGGRRARIVVQNSDDLALFDQSRLAVSAQIRLISGSGVDCGRFVPPPEERGRGDPPRVLMAARMLWDKGVEEFVEAARILKAQGRAASFELAGYPDPGNPSSIPEPLLREWRRVGPVNWLGHVDDMPALLASADIVVLPSYREGLPKSLVEAGACARPLIAADAPGCRDVITDGLDGLLVPVRDAPALARAIARLLDEPERARKFGEAARAKAIAKYDERLIAANTLAVYRELMTQRENSRSPAGNAATASRSEPAMGLRTLLSTMSCLRRSSDRKAAVARTPSRPPRHAPHSSSGRSRCV